MTSSLLDAARIAELLPFGPEFIFVDSVEAIQQGRSIKTRQSCTAERKLFAAHFKAGPYLVPGVVMAEQISQSALLLALLSDIMPVGSILVLGRLQCRFEAPAVLPCTLTAEVEIDFQQGAAIGFRGRLHLGDDRTVARCDCVAKIAPTPLMAGASKMPRTE